MAILPGRGAFEIGAVPGPDPSNWSTRSALCSGTLNPEREECHEAEEVSRRADRLCPETRGKPHLGRGSLRAKMGISEPRLYRWKKQFARMGVSEIRRLKQLEDENSRPKKLVADL